MRYIMRKLDKEQSAPDDKAASHRLPKLESLLRSEIGQVFERDLELPPDTLLTITAIEVLPDLSQARVGVSVIPEDKTQEIFKILEIFAGHAQRVVNQKLSLYRVPRLVFYLDGSLARAERIDHILDNLQTRE